MKSLYTSKIVNDELMSASCIKSPFLLVQCRGKSVLPIPRTPCPWESSSRPCEFCVDGLSVPPDTELPTGDGVTCSQAVGYAVTITADDADCAIVLPAQTIFCPTREEGEKEAPEKEEEREQ